MNRLKPPDISEEEHSTPTLTLNTKCVNLRNCIFFVCTEQ